MELSALSILGTRPVREEATGAQSGDRGELRSAWLSRLPSVEPGSMSQAYRSFRAQEAQTELPVQAAGATQAPGQPAILTGSLPSAFAAYAAFGKE
jgi:hypothetical protein